MNEAVKPEEPLFYIGLLIVVCYFFYWFYQDKKQKARRNLHIQLLKNNLLQAEKTNQNNESLLTNELAKHYSSVWIEKALKGYIFENMPLILLKVAMGPPNDIVFNTNKGQVWKYGANGSSQLVINIWEDQVTNWHQTK